MRLHARTRAAAGTAWLLVLGTLGGSCGTPGAASDTGRSCSGPADCTAGVCLSIGGGRGNVCTSACDSVRNCVPGWQCNSVAGHSSPICTCSWSHETCDGMDNDCDGVPDNDLDADVSCMPGGDATPANERMCLAGACAPCPEGSCAHTCTGALTGCNGAEVIARGFAVIPGTLSVDADSIYWCVGESTEAADLLRAQLDGGSPTLVATGLCPVGGVLIDGVYYWAESSTSTTSYTVYAMPVEGGPPMTLGSGPGKVATDLVATSETVFWGTSARAGVVGMPRAGGEAVVLTTMDEGCGPAALAVFDGYLYWIQCNGVFRLPVAGGVPSGETPTPFGRGCDGAQGLAVDDSGVYCAFGGGLDWIATEDGDVTRLCTPHYAGDNSEVVSDGTAVYFFSEGTVMKIPAGGGPSVVISSAPHMAGFAVGGDSVYWLETNSFDRWAGFVARAPK